MDEDIFAVFEDDVPDEQPNKKRSDIKTEKIKTENIKTEKTAQDAESE